MSKILNTSKNMLIIGRFKVLPGAYLPVVPYSSREKKDIDHFVKRGLLLEDSPKSECDAPVAPSVEPVVVVEEAPAVVEEAPVIAEEAPAIVEEVSADAEEAPAEGRKSRKSRK